MHIVELIKIAQAADASDLHLTAGSAPILRIDGRLRPLENIPPLSKDNIKSLVYQALNKEQISRFEAELELDASFEVAGAGRVRLNVHRQKGAVEAAFRIINPKIRSVEALGLPDVVKELATRPNGLVLVTGPAGVGKSTTLAAMIDFINTTKNAVIVTIEDPIEYVFTNKKSIIKQREIGLDTKSYTSALRHALRQDPDIIMIGEMRDLETIAIALTAAETGHLVLSTLHTPDAAQTIDRIIDIFPAVRQQETRAQLAGCLQGIISQQLLLRADTKSRVLALEILVATAAVRHVIKSGNTEQLYTLIQTGSEYGMVAMDKSLKCLVDNQTITYQSALKRVRNIEEFHRL